MPGTTNVQSVFIKNTPETTAFFTLIKAPFDPRSLDPLEIWEKRREEDNVVYEKHIIANINKMSNDYCIIFTNQDAAPTLLSVIQRSGRYYAISTIKKREKLQQLLEKDPSLVITEKAY